MKCQKDLAGYTILEVMIFLVVSGGILISAMTLVSGQQQRTQFTTSARDFESKIQGVISNVETGYFPSANDIKCTVTGMTTDPDAAPVPAVQANQEQGSNQDCVFLGKAVQFYKGADGFTTQIRAVTIAGKRLDFNSTTNKTEEPQSIKAYSPRPYFVAGQNTGIETSTISNEVGVTKVRYVTNYSPLSFDDTYEGLVVVPNVVLKSNNNVLSSLGNGRIDVGLINGDPAFPDTFPGLITSAITNLDDTNITIAKKGIVICLSDGKGSSARTAAVTIGIKYDESGGTFTPQASNQAIATDVFVDSKARNVFGCTPA